MRCSCGFFVKNSIKKAKKNVVVHLLFFNGFVIILYKGK